MFHVVGKFPHSMFLPRKSDQQLLLALIHFRKINEINWHVSKNKKNMTNEKYVGNMLVQVSVFHVKDVE